MSAAATLIWLAQGYCMIGAVVALAFLTIGMDRIDEDARGAYAFRPLLVPAILLIWPLVLWRWLREETGRADHSARYAPPRKAHGLAAIFMAVLIVAALLASFAVRQTWPADLPPTQISAPETSE
ncbi:hypothetical protein [Gymnodinialimonas hymeniacidonis]|uniref:hypothetical protein n=1 Tax=Gymnodinialimonas hymeniacidonis TaxID=3126508 RepID=UPI0034C6A131